MSLKDQLAEDLKGAIRGGDEVRKSSLRLLLTAISNAEIAATDIDNPDARRPTLDDQAVLGVIAKQVKQRRDSIDAFQKAGRQDLVDNEAAELRVLEAYLPAQMSREEIAEQASAVIAEVGAASPGDKGKVMSALMPRLAGRADGRTVNEVVTQLLTR